MSQFMSDKFLRARRAMRGEMIDEDRYCEGCGYNLRGLPFGQACPECGQGTLAVSGGSRRGATRDPLLTVDELERRTWMTGFRLAGAALLGAVVVRIVHLLLLIAPTSPKLTGTFLAGLALAVVWTFAVFLMTPRSLDRDTPGTLYLRAAARGGAIAWTVGLGCAALLNFKFTVAMQALLLFGAVAGHAFGWLGALIMLWIAMRIAEDAARETAARRFALALWGLPVLTVIQLGLPAIPWYSFLALSIVLVLPICLVLAWAWLMALAALGFNELSEHMRWAFLHAEEWRGREARIAEKKAAMEAEVRARIRSLPDDGPREDIPVVDRDGQA